MQVAQVSDPSVLQELAEQSTQIDPLSCLPEGQFRHAPLVALQVKQLPVHGEHTEDPSVLQVFAGHGEQPEPTGYSPAKQDVQLPSESQVKHCGQVEHEVALPPEDQVLFVQVVQRPSEITRPPGHEVQLPHVDMQELQVAQAVQIMDPSALHELAGQFTQPLPLICWPAGQEVQPPVRELQE